MTESSEKAFGETQTLAHLLEFLARLEKETEVKKKVIKDIKEEVEKYFKDVDAFADEDATGGYLYKTIEKSKELRRNIVKSEETEYRYYTNDLKEDETSKYSQHLIDNVFPLFGCLYYMYYECEQQCILIKGGDWKAEKCDGTGGDQKKHLHDWLRDQRGVTGRMIKRDFQQGELSTKTGNELFSPRTSTTALLYYFQGAQLQFALYYMLFLPKDGKWDNAQSGHALLFLEAFCKMVSENEFTDHYKENKDGLSIENLKSSCKTLKDKISAITKSEFIVPVACSDTVDYKDLLQPEHFSKYMEWLEDYLEQLIASLTEMANDASNWSEEALKTSETFGPYPWGFTFYDDWENKNKGQLKKPLSQLTQALSGLKNALLSISKGESKSERAAEGSSTSTNSADSADESSNSTASTVGGVIGGLGGLGTTAGAAYARSSFLGPVAEGIGKFFKGLIL